MTFVYDVISLYTQATVIYQCRNKDSTIMKQIRYAKSSGMSRGFSVLYGRNLVSYSGLECAAAISDNYQIVEVFQVLYLTIAILLKTTGLFLLYKLRVHTDKIDSTAVDQLTLNRPKNTALITGVIFLGLIYVVVYTVAMATDGTSAKAIGTSCILAICIVFVAVYVHPSVEMHVNSGSSPESGILLTFGASCLLAAGISLNSITLNAIEIDRCAELPALMRSYASITNMTPIEQITEGAEDQYFVTSNGFETCYNWRLGSTKGTWLIVTTIVTCAIVLVLSLMLMFGKQFKANTKKIE